MTERSIIMSGPMVRAILDGRKTQTRRLLREQPIIANADLIGGRWQWRSWKTGCNLGDVALHYDLGDRLWVRETWADIGDEGIVYRATDEGECAMIPTWRSPIHMPRRLSRLTLTITDVRVQRVQEISDEDAKAEGVQLPGMTRYHGEARDEFRCLWSSLNAKRGFGWDENPWVAALTFTAEKRNMDEARDD